MAHTVEGVKLLNLGLLHLTVAMGDRYLHAVF